MWLITKNEACENLKVSTRTLERLIRDGEIPFYRIGGSIRIEMEDLEAYVRRNRTQAQPMALPRKNKRGKKQAQKTQRIEYVPGMKVVG